MKIDTDILRTLGNEIVWADDNPCGHGFLVHAAGADVPDAWLEKNGLVAPEPEPKQETSKEPAKKPAAAKQTAPAANKQVKGPANDK